MILPALVKHSDPYAKKLGPIKTGGAKRGLAVFC